MNERIRKIAQEARDSHRFEKFVRHCQMEGLGSVDAEEDRFYSESQEKFFDRYERQMGCAGRS